MSAVSKSAMRRYAIGEQILCLDVSRVCTSWDTKPHAYVIKSIAYKAEKVRFQSRFFQKVYLTTHKIAESYFCGFRTFVRAGPIFIGCRIDGSHIVSPKTSADGAVFREFKPPD